MPRSKPTPLPIQKLDRWVNAMLLTVQGARLAIRDDVRELPRRLAHEGKACPTSDHEHGCCEGHCPLDRQRTVVAGSYLQVPESYQAVAESFSPRVSGSHKLSRKGRRANSKR